MYNKKRVKRYLIVMSLLAAVSLMGFCYSIWNDETQFIVVAETGDLRLQPDGNRNDYDIEILDTNILDIPFSIKNTGSLNAQLSNIDIFTNPVTTTGSAINICMDNENSLVRSGKNLTGRIILDPELILFELADSTEAVNTYKASIDIKFSFGQDNLSDSGWTDNVILTLNITKTDEIICNVPVEGEPSTQSAIEADEIEMNSAKPPKADSSSTE